MAQTVEVEVGKVELTFTFANSTKSQTAAKTLIDDTKLDYPSTEYLVTGTDTFTIPQTVQTESGATDQELIDAIKSARVLTDSTVTLSSAGSDIAVQMVFALNDTEFDTLVSTGNTLESTGFIDALATDLSVNASSIDITVSQSVAVVEITLLATGSETNPLDESTVLQLTSLEESATTEANTIVTDLGDGTVTVADVDLCGSRTCSGRGDVTTGVTDANGCVLSTGVCACTGAWWGINCETPCTCENDGVCTTAYCNCEYPFHGKRCELTKTEDCATCF